jgi:WD40 repeat protein
MKHLAIILAMMTLTGCFSETVYNAKATKQVSHSKEIITASDMSADGTYSLLADDKGSVCLWNNKTGKLRHKCLTGEEAQMIEVVKLSDNNQYFVTSNRVIVNYYSIASGKMINQWGDENIINDIALSRDGQVMLLGYRNGKAAVINTKTSQKTLHDKHRLDINTVGLTDDGSIAFTGSSDKTAVLWQTDSGKNLHVFKQKSRINHLDISADGKIGFTIDALNGRYFWDLNKGEQMAELDTITRFIEFNDSAFSANNQWFLTASPKQQINLWRVSDGAKIGEWTAKKKRERSSVLSIAYNGSGKFTSETSDGTLENWTLPPAK